MTKSLIIYAHPWNDSFNHHVMQKVKNGLKNWGHEVDLIDLHADNFDPVYHSHELKHFAEGKYLDPQCQDYANRLKIADEIFIIFPIWWYGPPAILKGFFDKVFLNGHIYQQNDKGEMEGLLNTKKASILTTAHISEDFLKQHFGNPIENLYLKGTLQHCGVQDIQWIHCGDVHLETSRKDYLERIDQVIKA